MTNKININLGDVQKTLFLPLWGRAVETEKKHPLLVDETAARIIEQVDYDFSPMTQNLDELTQIAWIERSLICDRIIRDFLTKYPDGTIVNIGCGLDTTFERVDNGKLRWYDLDLPDVIELRSRFICENERRRFITSSFLEKEWLDSLEITGNVLFVSAGVFYYFKTDEIKGFVIRLIDRFPNSELLFDVCSTLGMRVANKKVVASSGLDERSYLTWGIDHKQDLLAWDNRIELIGIYHYYRSPRIGIRNFLVGLFADLMGIQYMVHLRLGGTT